MKTPFPYAIHTARAPDPRRAAPSRHEKSFFKPISQLLCASSSPPSVGICSWKKIPDLCHAREWVSSSPARRPRLGWEGEYVQGVALSLRGFPVFAFISALARNFKQKKSRCAYIQRLKSYGWSRLLVSAPPWNRCCKQESASLTQKHIVLRINWPGAARKNRSGFDFGSSKLTTTQTDTHYQPAGCLWW